MCLFIVSFLALGHYVRQKKTTYFEDKQFCQPRVEQADANILKNGIRCVGTKMKFEGKKKGR